MGRTPTLCLSAHKSETEKYTEREKQRREALKGQGIFNERFNEGVKHEGTGQKQTKNEKRGLRGREGVQYSIFCCVSDCERNMLDCFIAQNRKRTLFL